MRLEKGVQENETSQKGGKKVSETRVSGFQQESSRKGNSTLYPAAGDRTETSNNAADMLSYDSLILLKSSRV